MLTIKRLSECTFLEAVKVWNRGFEGYFFPVNLDLTAFIQRMANEGLSPEHSVVAFDKEQAVGFVLNGIRTSGDQKIAWNGGTGVIPEYRHQGVGRQLMQATLDVYREEQVNVATLEAIKANEKAIQLYQKMGYKIVDELVFYTHTGVLPMEGGQLLDGVTVQKGVPQDVRSLGFYRERVAWQTQWASVRDGESLILMNQSGEQLAYALFKRTFDPEGKQTGIVLFQAEVNPSCLDAQSIMRCLLSEVYVPLDQSYQRSTVNTPASNELLTAVLCNWGFTKRAEQVWMTRGMD
ncbi:GNAT family N-acetyltransferase [Brevibacillus ginsengisoli]|uniref:GNAT family N-acetyltransferase n=1 Tax=Brevibacillus ginsengisoli TaxID=363854 RepID=UPI003CEEE41F